MCFFFFSSRRRHTRCALVTGVQRVLFRSVGAVMPSRRFPMKRRDLALALFVVLASAAPTAAHHPGADLDRVMGSKEKYFQLIDRPAPAFELMGAGEKAVTLADFTDKIVVLHFVYASCPDVCPLHAEKLAEVQAKVNLSPMKDMVQFVTITTDPAKDTADVLDRKSTRLNSSN